MRVTKLLIGLAFLMATGCIARTSVEPTSLTAFNGAAAIDGQVGGSSVSVAARINLRTTTGRIISVSSKNVRVYVTTTTGAEHVYYPPIQVHFIDGQMQIGGYNGSRKYRRTDIKKVEVTHLETEGYDG